MREIILTQLKETICHMELLSFFLKINNNKSIHISNLVLQSMSIAEKSSLTKTF